MVLFGFGKKEQPLATPAIRRIESVTVSETGLVCPDNQDHVYVDDMRGVYCVADGVGSAAEGARASEMVCRNLKMVLSASANGFAARVAAVRQAIDDANATIFAYARERGFAAMASTIAVLVLDPANPRHAAVCNVGDSRIYRIRGGMPELLTRDHRLAKGDNTLTRAVGARETVHTEWTEIESTHSARFVLCTDGVHDVLNAARLAVFAAAGSLETAAKRMTDDILRHGAPDNFSFVLLEV